MTAYFWGVLENYPSKAFAVYDRAMSPDRLYMWEFMKGERIAVQEYPIIFHIKGSLKDFAVYDVIDNDSPIPLISPKLQHLLNETCPDDVQYLDTIIHYKDGSITDYKAVNVTHTVLSIDHEQSGIQYFSNEPDVISWAKPWFLLSNCLGQHDLARDREIESVILLSEKLRLLCKKHRIRGLHFMTDEERNNIKPFA